VDDSCPAGHFRRDTEKGSPGTGVSLVPSLLPRASTHFVMQSEKRALPDSS
jgi:hypothetical protein